MTLRQRKLCDNLSLAYFGCEYFFLNTVNQSYIRGRISDYLNQWLI